MKVHALITTSAGRTNEGKPRYNQPGVIDVDDATGEDMIRKGQAKRIAQVAAEKESAKGEVSITKASGPTVKVVPVAKAETEKPADKQAARSGRSTKPE